MVKNQKIWERLRRAETLIEVVIAVFVVALGAAIATSLIVSSFQANTLSRDNLIAMNLAQEGIEAVRGIRDTNWLKYGFDKENCWNILPSSNSCNPAQIIKAGYYRVELDDKLVWQMTSVNPQIALNLATGSSANNDLYKLLVVDRNTSAQSTTPINLYSHNLLSYPPGVHYGEVKSDPQDGRFYRMIEILNVTNDPVSGLPVSMEVKSTVQWLAQGRANMAALNLILTNYQKVKK